MPRHIGMAEYRTDASKLASPEGMDSYMHEHYNSDEDVFDPPVIPSPMRPGCRCSAAHRRSDTLARYTVTAFDKQHPKDDLLKLYEMAIFSSLRDCFLVADVHKCMNWECYLPMLNF
ncbi:hypothetical protein LSAT2_020918 [Lamellibrachia satsuma]|nr:hypothetical protein LSAT2_020918 [Lamellibrachia satsuma]